MATQKAKVTASKDAKPAKVKAKTQAKPKAKPKAKAEPAKAKAVTKTQPKSLPKSLPKGLPKGQPKGQPKPQTQSQPKAPSEPKGEIELLAVGTSAPDFRLKSDTDATVTLSSLRGKTVVLYFYPKDSTPGCTVEACDFRDNLSRLTAKGALVFGISADSVDSHQRFKQKQSLNFPLLSDPEKKVLNAYKVWQEKSLYGRKFMGILRTTYVINGQGKISHVFPKVKVAGHVDQVLSVL